MAWHVAIPAVLLLSAAWLALQRRADAHCDTLDGPVVADAKAALERGDVAPVLKWIGADAEPEVKSAFEAAVRVRSLGDDAMKLADTWFFETLVRLHRAAEGAPYTGLKAAGEGLTPAVRAADQALASGSADELVRMVTAAAETGIRQRFSKALGAKKHSEDSVEDGRAYVAAYVDFVHYAERLHAAAAGVAEPNDEAPSGATPVEHHH